MMSDELVWLLGYLTESQIKDAMKTEDLDKNKIIEILKDADLGYLIPEGDEQ